MKEINGCKALGTVPGEQHVLHKMKAILGRFVYTVQQRRRTHILWMESRCVSTKLPRLIAGMHLLSLSFLIWQLGTSVIS